MNIKNILIAGGGMMGKNIAFVFTSNPDYQISVYDIYPTDVAGGIRKNCAQLIEKGVITAEELEQAVKAMRQEAEEPKELTLDEMDKAAGGVWWTGEDAPDGHEMGCAISWHHYTYQKENNIWCNMSYYCDGKHQEAPNWMDV